MVFSIFIVVRVVLIVARCSRAPAWLISRAGRKKRRLCIAGSSAVTLTLLARKRKARRELHSGFGCWQSLLPCSFHRSK